MKRQVIFRNLIRQFVLTGLFVFFGQVINAQLTPGFLVNGQPIAQGTTINVCQGNTVTYTSTASNYTAISWFFHLGTPVFSTLPNPAPILYNTVGTDSTIQLVTDGVVVDTFFIIVHVSDVHPDIDFASNNNVCSGTPQQFNPTITGTAPFTYSWVFGDGGTANSSNPIHTFTSLGCGTQVFYNFLTVTDATGCTDTITKPITVLQAPDVAVEDPDPIPFSNCENSPTPTNPDFTLTINNVSPSIACIASYTIDWGDGNTVNNATFPATHTYTQIGAFDLVVTAIGSNGCTSSKTYVVANQTNPAGSLGTLGTTTNLCAPATVPFTISNWQINSPGTQYILEFGDGQSVILTHPLNAAMTQDTVYHTYTESSCPSNSFIATLTVVNACGSTPYTAGGIQVLKKAHSAFSVSQNAYCVGQSVCFNNTTLAGYGPSCTNTATTTWDFGDGSPTSNVYNPCHTYSAPGIYTVTLTTTNYCGPSIYSLQVCITTPPVPDFIIDVNDGCAPLNVAATNATVSLNNCINATYKWTVTYTPANCGTLSSWGFTNGTNADSTNPSFVFNGAGTYTITLAVTNPCGVFTVSKTVNVKQPPQVTIAPIADHCGTVSLVPSATVSNCGTGALSYAWAFQGGNPASSGSLNPGTVTFSGAGVHIITLAVTNECGTTTTTQQFTIDTVSVADAGPPQNMCGTVATLAANTPVIGTGLWTFVSGPAGSVITNPTAPTSGVSGLVPGVYVFKWTITNGTCSSSSDVTITIQSGPTPSIAGNDQELCLATSSTLAANTPTVGTGLWTFVSGPAGYSITDPTNPATTVTGLLPGIYIFRWTTSFANCAPSSDDVQITVYDNPSIANAGADQTICSSSATMAGNVPSIGSGVWSFISGPAGYSISNSSDPATTITGLVPGTYLFKWSISNGVCPVSNDTVQIIVTPNPTTADAGPDQILCVATAITMAGNNPVVGIGEWAYVGGPAGYTITDPNNPVTTITGLVPGSVYVFQWTISNGVCPSSSDQVQITINEDVTVADAGPDQNMCGTMATMAANTPLIGTGAWSQFSGPSGYTITNQSDPLTTITGLTPGTYVFRWTITNGSCVSTSDVIIIIQSGPTPANAGIDQEYCLATSATLAANTPVIGTGLWSYVSGPSGYTITDPTDPSTTVTGLSPGIYKFKWTISFSNCNPSADSVQITIYDNPTPANAGNDQTICASSVNMTGNNPAIGTGLWSYISGPTGYTITAPGNPTTTITGLVPGTYLFKWTTSNGVCLSSSDTVQIIVTATPTIADAGQDQVLCNASSVSIVGNTPVIGTGSWSYFSGPAGSSITDPANPSTTVTGLVPGIYVFQWTIANGVCPSSIDQVQINNLNSLQSSINSPITTICSGQQVTITGANPTGGMGTYTYQWQQSSDGINWSDIGGANSQNYIGTLTDSVYIRCYITSLPCEAYTNAVFIAVQPSVTNNIIAADQSICINTAATIITGSNPAGGNNVYSYQWQQSTDGGTTWSDIPGAAGIDYDPGISIQTTLYRRVVTTTLCSGPQASTSNAVTITVNNDSRALFTANPTIACAPFDLSTVINVTTFPDRNGQYQWFANGASIGSNTTGVFPGYTISSQGQTVTIKLVTTSQHGCKPDSIEIVFSTVATSFAGFTKTPAGGCGPLNVTFNNTSSILNSSIQYFWNFGNGITSTIMDPGTITFLNDPNFKDTTYHITLKAYNGCDTTYHYDSVTVFPNSKARFAVDTTRGCSPFTIHITNTSPGNNTSYYWDFGDGTKDTTHTNGPLVHTYYTGTITNYDIQLISENQCTRDTQKITIVVSPNSIQAFVNANGNQLSGCAPHTVTFNNGSVGASQLTWNFGDNTPPVITTNNQTLVTHTFLNAGNYTVTIRLQNDCSDTTIYRYITVYDAPVADFVTNPIRICTSQSITVTNNSSNANSYEWQWGDGNLSTFTNGQHPYGAPGNYTITLIAKKVHPGGFVCTDTAIKVISVVDKITAQINVAPGNACAPYTLNVNAGNITGYDLVKWIIYDSSATQGTFEVTGTTATHVYDVPGTYWVKLVVYTTLTGCADSITYPFQVHNTPKTTFEPQFVKACSHDTIVNYTATTTNMGNEPVNYKWFVNGSIEGTINPFSYNFQAGLYNTVPIEFDVQALAQNAAGCGDTSWLGKMIVQPLPWPGIVVSPSLVLQQPDYTFTFKDTVATNPNKTYTWYMGDRSQQTKNGREITYEYGDTGTYNVRLLVTDYTTGCSAMDSVYVTILYVPGYLYVPNAMCLGCSNYELRKFLPLGNGLKSYHLTIFNGWGQKIFETTSIDANGSPNVAWEGIYKNQPLQQDTYTWQIEARFINDTEWKGMLFPGSNKPVKAGFITIIK